MRTAACAVLVLSLFAATRAAAQQPARDALLDKAAAYLSDLLPRLTNIVAEEQYVQQITSPSRRRTLLSDYLLVHLQDTGNVATFRDVFEVDGKPVRDHDQRLQRLFIDSPRTALEQATEIARESARHNISNIGTISNPFLAVAFLQPAYRDHFRFQNPRAEKSMGPDVWAVQYEEFVSPTILKGNGNRDVFARGRVWVEGATGRVLKTELRLGAQSVRAGLAPIEILCTFRFDEDLNLMVPTEMTEYYPDARMGDVRGTATYGRFRQFGVTARESLQP